MGLAFLITTENLQLLSERKVLKEADYAALLDAEAVVEAARGEARHIVAQAAQQAEAQRRKGHEEGLRQARADHARRLVSDAVASEQQLLALRRSMAQIVVKAIGQFMAEQPPQALFEAALRRVDSLVRHEPYIAMHVAPGDEDRVRAALQALGNEAGWACGVVVSTDAALAEGACVLRTASGTLEIGVDAQLEAYRKAVEQGGPAAAGSAP